MRVRLRVADCVLDQRLVVRGNGGVTDAGEHPLHQSRVDGVDVGLVWVGNRLRLQVRALDEAEVRCEVEQRLEIVGRSVEVGLEHGADVVESRLAQPAEDAERRVDELRLLHVDSDERPLLEQAAEVLEGQLLVDVEAEVRELQRHIRLQPFRGNAVDHLPVGRDDRVGLCRFEHALAEQRGVRREALLVQPAEDGDALVERLAGDEARGPEPAAMPADEAPGRAGCRPLRGFPCGASRWLRRSAVREQPFVHLGDPVLAAA